MTDGDLMRVFAHRHAGWTLLLETLRAEHAGDLGRAPQAIGWTPGDTLGIWSWFGFFWHPERFWFGYGLLRGQWTPLIEADIRNHHAKAWLQLRSQLPGSWSVDVGGHYARLWASLPVAASAEDQIGWFRERSRELHEYSLVEK